MIPEQQDVHDFHKALDIPVGDYENPKLPDQDRCELRAKLIMEEASETASALLGVDVSYQIMKPGSDPAALQYLHEGGQSTDSPPSLKESIDGMVDTLVVTYGTAVELGVDLAPFWDIVHTSNMAKEGGPTREDGKKLKPEGWEAPDIAGLFKTLYGFDPS